MNKRRVSAGVKAIFYFTNWIPWLLQAESAKLMESLHAKEEKLKSTEEASEKKDKRIDELQRLLGGMEQESATLREAIRSREEELRELRKIREEGQKGDQRSANKHTLLYLLKLVVKPLYVCAVY